MVVIGKFLMNLKKKGPDMVRRRLFFSIWTMLYSTPTPSSKIR
jgi:hypothetical protein